MAYGLLGRRVSYHSIVGAILLLSGGASLLLACGADDSGGGVAGGGAIGNGGTGKGGSGGVSIGGSGGGISGTGGGGTCSPACASGTFCSGAGHCISDGTCEVKADCETGKTCDTATNTCVLDTSCGAEGFDITSIPPNMFISLDRSCSMTEGGGGGQTKWQIAVAALNAMLTTFNGKIRWGLGMFPDKVTPDCQQSAPQFPVGDGNEAGISAILTASLQASNKFFPQGPCVTNIDTGLQQASQDPAFADKTRKSFVLLITDGKQSSGCSAAGADSGSEGIIQTMNQNGISTFVVGFDNSGAIDPVQMNKFADLGGVPNNDPADPTTHYYKANSAATLQAALDKIGGSIVSCTFQLNKTPSDSSKVFVYFDNVKVPVDPTHAAGWDYDAATNSITFYGADCDKLKANSVSDVDVVFGCDQPIPG